MNEDVPWSIALLGLLGAMGCSPVIAQPDTLLKHITLDEFVVSARASGFNVEAFVQQVMDDTTFHKAFLNTRYYPHRVISELEVRAKKEKRRATMHREGALVREGSQAFLRLDSISEHGPLRKRNGGFRYLTVEMYDDVFFRRGPYRAENTIRSRRQEIDRSSRFDRYKSELKKFMFDPGQEIASVPFIGDKLALYDADMAEHYDHRIWADTRDGQACWVFSSNVRTGHERDAVIQEMHTWFHQENGQVMAREYHIQHASIILDFDIRIKVRNALVNGALVPLRIDYDGEWDIPLNKAEAIRFNLLMDAWQVE
ncbi:MAG: hypothetical protein KDB88_04720 [Flavobacteriales bacterium]|nr:hypothetical protein [Flavobacteriales bacterium]